MKPKISKSAQPHATYLVTHVKTADHEQIVDKSGFTGVNHEARAKSAGYTLSGGSGERVLYGSCLTPTKIVNLNLEAVHQLTAQRTGSTSKIRVMESAKTCKDSKLEHTVLYNDIIEATFLNI